MKIEEFQGWYLILYALFFDELQGYMIGQICDDGYMEQVLQFGI